MMLSTRIFVTFTLLLSGAVNASAGTWIFGGAASPDRPTISPPSEQNITLTQAMANVQDILLTIRNSTSCKRRAAKSLVDSCVKYDHKDPANSRSTDVELEDFQKLYTIRMSSCELEDAAQPMPPACNAALHAPSEVLKGTSHIKICLDALYQDINAWTTYQSMKSNALVMCQAMRVEQDKDEQLHFFQVLMSSTSNITDAMKNNKEDFDQLFSNFCVLKDGMRDFYLELHKDNRDIKAAIKESWNSIQKDMSGVSGDIHGLLQFMGEANQNLHAYTSQVDNALSHAKDLSTQMDSRWATGLVKIKDGLEEARDAYQYQLELHLTEFHQRVFAITNSMETANGLSGDLLSKLSLLSDDLDVPLEKVGELAIQAEYIKDAQSAMFTQFEEKVDPILVNLMAAGEHAAFFSTWMRVAAEFVGSFLDKIWPTISAFLIWFALIFIFVFRGCWKVLGLATGSMVALIVTLSLALMLTSSLDPRQLGKAFVDSHPAFFQETPPYLSMFFVFLAGIGTTMLLQSMLRPRPVQVYDPAVQLESLPQFQDDLDLHELKYVHGLKQEHYHSRY